VDLKNNGGKHVDNANLEISYYGKEGYLIKKVLLKNKLNCPIPPGASQTYKIRLNRHVVNTRNEEYPYSQWSDVGEFDVKVQDVRLGRKK
jgi:hypothetical protein